MAHNNQKTVPVPGDGYCGLHACLAHTLLAYKFMQQPAMHLKLRQSLSRFDELAPDFQALVHEDLVPCTDEHLQLLNRLYAALDEFPVWQTTLRDQISLGVRGQVLNRFFGEHKATLESFCRESDPSVVGNNAFFTRWRTNFLASSEAGQQDDNFETTLTQYASAFGSGGLCNSSACVGDPVYNRLFSSFCKTYSTFPNRRALQRARLAANGCEQGVPQDEGFYFDRLYSHYRRHGFSRGAPQSLWLGNNDIQLMLSTCVMPQCFFELIGLKTINPSSFHWEVSVDTNFIRLTSLDWQLGDKIDFSLVPLSTGMQAFTLAIQDLVEINTASTSFWDLANKMAFLRTSQSRLADEISLFECACYSGELVYDADEVEELSSSVENMRKAVASISFHYKLLEAQYSEMNILLKACIWIRDKIREMMETIDNRVSVLESPTLIACSA